MQYRAVIKEAAKKLNLSEELIDKIYKAYWRLIINKMRSLELKDEDGTHILSEEEFNNLQTSINIPSLGKIYITYKDYVNQKKAMQYVYKAKENRIAQHRLVDNNENL